MKKKVIIIISIVVVVIAAVIVGFSILMPSTAMSIMGSNVAYVTPVSSLTESDIAFTSNRYSGVVETQKAVSVKADSDKTIKETYVKEGDTVKKGDKLFAYDVEDMKTQLSQCQLDLDQANSEITSYNSQISSLENEKNSASENNRLSLENEISSLKIDLKRAQYTVESKTKEIEKLNKSINNNVVTSSVDGKIQSIGSSDTSELLSDDAYITITTNDDYRIKSMISEENITTFSEGSAILVRSRTDESQTWTGTISSIDTTNPSENSDSLTGTAETDSKYPVYIALDSADGLIVGQHVTVELSTEQGEGETSSNPSVPEFFICDIDTEPYVWCADESGLLEKRSVELGELDEQNFTYEILSGLSTDDLIAFPEDRLAEGMTTIFDDITDESMESVEVE